MRIAAIVIGGVYTLLMGFVAGALLTTGRGPEQSVGVVFAAATIPVGLGTWLRVRDRAELSALLLAVGGLVPVLWFPHSIILTAVLLMGALFSFQAPAKGTPPFTSLR